MVKDAVNRIKSDKEEDKGSKIYNNKDIYAFNGLGPKGKWWPSASSKLS